MTASTATHGWDRLFGGSGDDVLRGGSGGDEGGSGLNQYDLDELHGGTGDDALYED